jgi:predicted transcriptional regulator
MKGGCIATNILEHARELEREVETLNQRMVAIKHPQASLIAAINSAINEHKGSGASVYLDGIMENLFSK